MVVLAKAAAAMTTKASATKAKAEICVIGGGAAGLCAAKHLVQYGLHPTIIEAHHDIGGMWSASASDATHAKTWDDMRTNLSRYCCAFADYPWSTAFPQDTISGSTCTPSSFFFPTTLQMHEYLKCYSQHFLESNENVTFRLGCQVTQVKPTAEQKYQVTWKPTTANHPDDKSTSSDNTEKESESVSRIFDGVVVASGFFSDPAWPNGIDHEEWNKGVSGKAKVWHSSWYRNPAQILKALSYDNPDQPPTIAICGSSFSALEIASHIAEYNPQHSVNTDTDKKRIGQKDTEATTPPHRPVVKHICSSLPWIMPKFVHESNIASGNDPVGDSPFQPPIAGFIPLDIALYRRHHDGLQKESVFGSNPIASQQKHTFLQKLLGTRKQGRITNLDSNSNHIQQPWDDPNQPVFASISNDYVDLVNHGRIQIVPGRLQGINGQGDLVIYDEDETTITTLEKVDALISATGFTTRLDYLDSSTILDQLEYQPNNQFSPLILCEDVYHPNLPQLAFVGMYRGTYFGVMDLQAHLAAARMAARVQGNVDFSSPEHDEIALDTARQLREQVPTPQFPRGDYVGRMDALATKIKEYPLHHLGDAPHLTQQGNPVIPSMYQADPQMAQKVLGELKENLQHCQEAGHVTPFILKGILGKYKFHRTLTQIVDGSAQTVSGTIRFSLETDEGSGEDYVLYREDGTLLLPNGMAMDVFREYHYLVNLSNGALEIFFVENEKRAHLFLSLLFQRQNEQSAEDRNTWIAGGDHLCIKDMYNARFEVDLDGLSANHIQMQYNVKGPAKDYCALTILTPLDE